MPDIKKASFLWEEASQILALSDALSCESGPEISAAFDAVARTRGLAQIARDAGIPLDALYRAPANPDRPDIERLKDVVDALASRHSVLGDGASVLP